MSGDRAHLRVVSWNIDARPSGLLDAKVDLLRRLQPDLALIQEIGRSVYRALLPHPSAHERMHRTSRLFAWGALSTDLTTPRGSEYRLGCAVLGTSTTAMLNSSVLKQIPFDVSDPARLGFLWRTVAAQVAVATGQLLTVCSLHGRPRAGAPPVGLQSAFHAGIAQWLSSAPDPVLFGIDAAPPVLDDTDPLVGPDPAHPLVEVVRATHDHLWASPGVEILHAQGLADEAAAVGSEHALLLADLRLRAS